MRPSIDTPAGRERVVSSAVTTFTIEHRVKVVKPSKVRGKKATLGIVNDGL
jgi:hypothetical protein